MNEKELVKRLKALAHRVEEEWDEELRDEEIEGDAGQEVREELAALKEAIKLLKQRKPTIT